MKERRLSLKFVLTLICEKGAPIQPSLNPRTALSKRLRGRQIQHVSFFVKLKVRNQKRVAKRPAPACGTSVQPSPSRLIRWKGKRLGRGASGLLAPHAPSKPKRRRERQIALMESWKSGCRWGTAKPKPVGPVVKSHPPDPFPRPFPGLSRQARLGKRKKDGALLQRALSASASTHYQQ